MINHKICSRCGVKYNLDTVPECPVCFPRHERMSKKLVDEMIREMKKCVSLSRKGKFHKQPSGMHIVYDKRFRTKLLTT